MKNGVELPDGSWVTEAEVLSALAWEAKRRGISYGKLVANTSERERKWIVQGYRDRWKGEKRG